MTDESRERHFRPDHDGAILNGSISRLVFDAWWLPGIPIPTDRQLALAVRWIVDFADARKGTPMKQALASEIMEAYQGQGNAIRKRDEVHKMAQANKAFAHFRW